MYKMTKYSYSLIIIIYSIILLIFSATKFCINCKYYKKNFFTNSDFGKCSKFIKKDNINSMYFLVNGYNNNNYNYEEYYYCTTARQCDHMCGEEGIFYEKKTVHCFQTFY